MKTCIVKENFCQMCCQYHIGESYPGKRFQCTRKCESIVDPEKAKKKKLGKWNVKNKEKEEAENKKFENEEETKETNKINKILQNYLF